MDSSRLVHGVFNSTVDIQESLRMRCAANGIDVTRFSWVTPRSAPDFTDDQEVVVVLDLTLGTLQDTFDFGWEWAAAGQPQAKRSEYVRSATNRLRLLSDDRPNGAKGDGPDFKPWTRAWRRIKLDTHVGKRPIDVRNVKNSPGCALLFAAAQHPERIRTRDFKQRWHFWLPGLKCNPRIPKHEQMPGPRWSHVPYLQFYSGDKQVSLELDAHSAPPQDWNPEEADWAGNPDFTRASPVFVD